MMFKRFARVAVCSFTLSLGFLPALSFECPPDNNDNCVEINIPAGADENGILFEFQQQPTGWSMGDFLCASPASGVLEVEQEPDGSLVIRNILYEVLTETTDDAPHTLRAEDPDARLAYTGPNCSDPQPFRMWASLDGGPEHELLDNTSVVLTGGGGEIRITASTVYSCQAATESQVPVPALGTWTLVLAGLTLVAGGALLIALRP